MLAMRTLIMRPFRGLVDLDNRSLPPYPSFQLGCARENGRAVAS